MYVGYEGEIALGGSEFFGDGFECLGGFFIWGGDAYDFAASFGEGEALLDGGLDVLRLGGGHRLDAYGVAASDRGVADAYFSGGPSFNSVP